MKNNDICQLDMGAGMSSISISLSKNDKEELIVKEAIKTGSIDFRSFYSLSTTNKNKIINSYSFQK